MAEKNAKQTDSNRNNRTRFSLQQTLPPYAPPARTYLYHYQETAIRPCAEDREIQGVK